MKRLTVYIFLFAALGLIACILSGAFALSRSMDTAAQLAAEELRRPPGSSEIIAHSLDQRTAEEEKGGGFLATFGALSLIGLAVAVRFGYFWFKANYLRQNRLNTRASIQARQPNGAAPVPRAPRYMLPDQNSHNRGSDYDQDYQ